MSRWIDLVAEPEPVPAGPLVYSTRPRVGRGTDGHQYYVKGPETPILVAEAVGYELAEAVGLRVPDWAWCYGPSDRQVYFASLGKRVRIALDVLLTRDAIQRREFLCTCIALDIWIANNDRNMGGIVAEPIGGVKGSEVHFVAIDFEKSAILRGISRFEVTERYPPKTCWPNDELARHCVGLPFPTSTCDRISEMTEDSIAAMLASVSRDLGARHAVDWSDGASNFLASRARRIHDLVREGWNA